MSFRIEITVDINQTETLIYNNDFEYTFPIGNFTDNSKIRVVGINNDFSSSSLTTDNSENNYVSMTLPVLTVAKNNSFEYIRPDLIVDRNSNYRSFVDYVDTISTDYVLIFINDLNGYTVETNVMSYLNRLGSTLLDGQNSGSWIIMLKPIANTRSNDFKKYEVIREAYDDTETGTSIYYLFNTEFGDILNKDRWNQLFEDAHETDDFQDYYQSLFDTLDPDIYADDSDYLVILSRIHHHLTHPKDNDLSGTIEDDEQPWYDIYPDQLSPDMNTIYDLVKTSTKTLKRAGLEKFNALSLPILRYATQPNRFLSNAMVTALLNYRNSYTSARQQFETKLSLTLT